MEYRTAAIQEVLSGFPNVQLSISPTPIYRLSRLSSHLGANIYIMREDLTGFTIGGNKVRKLDYLIHSYWRQLRFVLLIMKSTKYQHLAWGRPDPPICNGCCSSGHGWRNYLIHKQGCKDDKNTISHRIFDKDSK